VGPLAILVTGTESLDDVLVAARMSLLTILGEPIFFDLKHIAPGGSALLREVLLADIAVTRAAQRFADLDLEREQMINLVARNKRIVWLTWRAYRAAIRAEQPS
jgi:hypothetical protein